jgi:release factor glutamine methyltransferase
MKTVGEILDTSIKFLGQRGIDRPRKVIEELLSSTLCLPRLEIYMQFDRPLQPQELDQMRNYLKLAAKGEPWQYIVGEMEFLGCHLKVGPGVLIPRQETEILADKIVKELPEGPCAIWDICTGSGCLGLAVKKKRPDCTVILSDLSETAVEIARGNAKRCEVEVEVRQGDLLGPFCGAKADVVICNPPYISERDYLELESGVRDWEPKMALVGGVTGFEFYERLARELPAYLNEGARIYFEIGTGMGEEIKKIFVSSGWNSVGIMQDWASHDRFALARIN